MRIKNLYLLILIFFSVSACKKEYTIVEGNTIKKFNKADYPLNVGNQWRFQAYDSFSKITDTITLLVISKSTQGLETNYECELYENQKLVDTAMYVLSDSKIRYNSKRSDYSYFGNFSLSLPFQKGDKWQGGTYLQDTTMAGDIIPSIKILGVVYENVYSLTRSFSALGGYRLSQTIFLSPKIGIIYQSFNELDGGIQQQQSFQLIDYDLK